MALQPPPPPPPAARPTVDEVAGWPIVAVFALLLIGVGFTMLVQLPDSVALLARLLGWALIINGFAGLSGLGSRGELDGAGKAGGVSLVLVGIVAITWPEITLWSMAILAGSGLLLVGAFEVMVGLARRPRAGWSLDLGLGALGIAFGAVALAGPATTVLALATLFGLWALATGILTLALVVWLLLRVQ
jgi:hypothetical protein